MQSKIFPIDYRHAVLQVAWLRVDQTRHLIFAAAELLPKELPRPPDEQELNLRVTRLGNRACVYFRRYVLGAEQALAWYAACRDGSIVLPEEGMPKHLLAGELFAEPNWPALILGGKFHFHGEVPSTTRTHHLYPQSIPTEISHLFGLHPEARQWVSDHLFVSLLRYPELTGSIHLLAPNPVLRAAELRLHVADDGTEGSRIHLVTREGYAVEGLQLTLTEHRPTGICAVHQVAVQEPYLIIPHESVTEQVELTVSCPTRGLLEWQEPVGFVRQIKISSHLVAAEKRITVPGKAGEAPENYTVRLMSEGGSNTQGITAMSGGIPSRLRMNEAARQKADEAERLGQKWFHGDRAEATAFIRGLIGKARQRVWIVDPYFATIELFGFALATTYSDIEVVILTSGYLVLKNPDETDPNVEAGEMLLKQLSGRSETAHVKVRVMTGMATVHDRFLVIDDDVWFTGNSLNSIGERAGMMISLPEPASVITKLEAVINDGIRTKSLADWVAQRNEATSQ